MKRFVFLAVLASMLVLTACSGNASPTTAPTATVPPIPTQTDVVDPQITTTTPVTLGKLGDPTQCSVVSMLPPPLAGLPSITDADWLKGDPEGRIEIIVYSDFQCPGCAAFAPVLDQMLAEYPENVKIVYRHFPLSIHPLAPISAQAAEAAGLQEKFWEMHDVLFANQSTWGALSAEEAEAWFVDQAGKLGLDKEQFAADLNSEAVSTIVQNQLNDSVTMRLSGTPTLIMNGFYIPFQYIPTVEDLAGLAEQILGVMALEPRAYKACPPVVIENSKQYVATLKTTKGDIVINLLDDQAPLTVNSFVFLAREGWFDNVPFHRVLDGFVAQTGDPSGTGMGGPGYEIVNEIAAGLSYDKAGVVGMANSGADTNGSQFFITYAPTTDLDGGYTIFGQVTEESMAVVNALTKRNPAGGGTLPEPDYILSVVIEEK